MKRSSWWVKEIPKRPHQRELDVVLCKFASTFSVPRWSHQNTHSNDEHKKHAHKQHICPPRRPSIFSEKDNAPECAYKWQCLIHTKKSLETICKSVYMNFFLFLLAPLLATSNFLLLPNIFNKAQKLFLSSSWLWGYENLVTPSEYFIFHFHA